MPRRNQRRYVQENHRLADRLNAEFTWRQEQKEKHQLAAVEKRTRRGARGGANRTEETA